MARPFKCPYCGVQGSSVSKGVRRTKTMGDRRVRLCKACGRKFTPKNQKTAEQAEPKAASGAKEERADQSPGGTPEFYQAAEPAEALGKLFPPPDEEWTS